MAEGASFPNGGRTPREEEIWDAWRRVIRAGLLKVGRQRIKPLTDLFGLRTGPTDDFRWHLLAIACDTDAPISTEEVHESWSNEGFPDDVRVRLHVVRAGPVAYRNLDAAREEAIAVITAIDPSRYEPLETFRRGEHGERRVLCELLDITRRRYLEPADETLDGPQAVRSHGVASQVAMGTVGEGKREPGRFWSRPSTVAAVAALAKEKTLTVYLGTDGDFGVSALSRSELFLRAIEGRLKERGEADEANSVALRHLVASVPSAQLGSILRQLHFGDRGYRKASEGVLRRHLENCINDSKRDGPLARSVTYLAFVMHNLGRDIALMSEAVGPELDHAAEDRRRRYPRTLGDIGYVTDGKVSEYDRKVRRIEVQGRERDYWAQSLVVGELDFEADPLLGERGTPSRLDRLLQVLSSRPVLFVGSDLTDSALVSTLARTSDSPHRRYALVLVPGYGASLGLDDEEQAASRWLLAQRYLHLGVVPVIVDLPYEIPQALREVALQAEHGGTHDGYDVRLRRWTERLDGHRGIKLEDDRVAIDPEFRGDWKAALEEAIANVPSRRRSGRLDAELWLRDGRSETLHRVVSTDGRRNGQCVVDLFSKLPMDGSSKALALDAFQRGHSVEGDLRDGSARFGVAHNVVQYGEKGERLPVGVVTILAGAEDGRLHQFAADRAERGELENEQAEQMRILLPPL